MGKPFVKDLLEACRLAAFPKDKKLLYERKIMNELDIIAQRKYAHKTGFAEGRVEGKAEEREQTLKGLLNLIAAGVPEDTIASCMGLSLDELRSISEKGN